MELEHVNTIADFNKRFGFEDTHPLVNVVDYSQALRCDNGTVVYGFYMIKLKTKYCGEFVYGRTRYDYTDGSIFCFAPGQVINIDLKVDEIPTSVCLVFHPDLIRGTELGEQIRSRYPYFMYDINEALNVDESEKQSFLEAMERIRRELNQGSDPHSQTLIRLNIELLLEYLLRLYDRQFQRRTPLNQETLGHFEHQLHRYYEQHLGQELGLPTVEYFANLSGYSAKYFSETIKKAIGIGAQDFITSFILDQAKQKLTLPRASMKEIAYELGFQYPQHFTRFFKRHMGCTPKDFKERTRPGILDTL